MHQPFCKLDWHGYRATSHTVLLVLCYHRVMLVWRGGRSLWTHTEAGELTAAVLSPAKTSQRWTGQQPMLPAGSPSHWSRLDSADESLCRWYLCVIRYIVHQCCLLVMLYVYHISKWLSVVEYNMYMLQLHNYTVVLLF